MVIRRKKDEIIITISSHVKTKDLEQLVDYLRYTEIAGKSKAKETDLNNLVSSIKRKRHIKSVA
jgi:hypothetical protein